MSGRGPAAPWLVAVGGLLVWIVASALAYVPVAGQEMPPGAYVVYGVPYVAFAAVGGLILRSSRASRVGWIMGAIGVFQGLALLGAEVARLLAAGPAGSAAGWIVVVLTPLSVASTALIVVLLLVFPDGRLPSPGWRWFLAGVLVLVVAVVVHDVVALPQSGIPGMPASPLAAPALAAFLAPIVSFAAFPLAVLVASASLIGRYRHGSVVVRQQIKWFALAAVVLAVCEAGNVWLGNDLLSGLLDAAGKLAVVAAIGVAVLRHRLYDVDLAISRTLAYGWLAVVVSGVYVALVVGVGSALGGARRPDLALSLVATIVVAVVSLPLRARLQELANRLVYGRRQAPYESLAGFTRRLADRSALDDLLPGIAAALGDGLRARNVAVYLTDDDGASTVAATWPAGAELPPGAPASSVAIPYREQELGRLAVWADAGLTAGEERLLGDLAHQAGLVLHNAHLTAELGRRLVELRASRVRLVAAQDAERRRFERDLHDGAQQDLVTVRMTLGEAERLAADSAPGLVALLARAQEHTASTLENIRRLSRGLYPPLLQSHGLAPALVAHARRLPLPVEVDGTDQRWSAEVETAVYFCCVEALQNVVKHAGATAARVTLEGDPTRLDFAVTDDGHGFCGREGREGSGLQNMTDRLEALGGWLRVRSDPTGTEIRGSLPSGASPGASGIVEGSSKFFPVPHRSTPRLRSRETR